MPSFSEPFIFRITCVVRFRTGSPGGIQRSKLPAINDDRTRQRRHGQGAIRREVSKQAERLRGICRCWQRRHNAKAANIAITGNGLKSHDASIEPTGMADGGRNGRQRCHQHRWICRGSSRQFCNDSICLAGIAVFVGQYAFGDRARCRSATQCSHQGLIKHGP